LMDRGDMRFLSRFVVDVRGARGIVGLQMFSCQ
jgi:hypothetical protein